MYVLSNEHATIISTCVKKVGQGVPLKEAVLDNGVQVINVWICATPRLSHFSKSERLSQAL